MNYEIDLDVIGAIEGTDKCSVSNFKWDYLRHYQEIFYKFRDEPINFIEIGVDQGFSIPVWNAFFSKATIIGVDINNKCKQYESDRNPILIGSQDDPVFLNHLCNIYPPTIFIDDGSHLAHHVIFTFKHVFPFILPDGIYVIEDVAFHYADSAPQLHGFGDITVPDYFMELAHACLSRSYRGTDPYGIDKYIFEQIDHVEFIGSAILIHKRPLKNLHNSLHTAKLYLDTTKYTNATHYYRYANFLLLRNGPIETAEEVIKIAISLEPENIQFYDVLIAILMKQGRTSEVQNTQAIIESLNGNRTI